MHRRAQVLGWGVAVTVLGLPATALAQPFGEQGQFVISVPGVFGVTHTDTKIEPDEAGLPDVETSDTQFELLGGDGATFAFDYLPIDGLSVGASFSYQSNTGEQETIPPTGPSSKEDVDEQTTVNVGVRIGYAFMFTEQLGLWPVGTLGYTSSRTKSEADALEFSASFPVIGASLPLVIVPAEHFGISVGPGIGTTISGSGEIEDTTTNQTVDVDFSVLSYGIAVGIFGYI